MSFRFSSGAARGRTILTATLFAFVLTTLAPLESFAQIGVPVYHDRTKAKAEAWPGDTNARAGVQNLLISPADSLRHLAPGSDVDGAWVYQTNAPQNLLWYHPNQIQTVGVYPVDGPTVKPIGVDSFPPLPALGATMWEAWITATGDDSTSALLFAVQLRKHRVESGDSLSTIVWQPQRPPTIVGNAALDTLGLTSWATLGSRTTGPPATVCWPGEIPVFVPCHPIGSPSPRARVVRFYVNGQDFGNADFMSARVRLIKQYDFNGAVYAQANEQAVSYRWTFLGYR